MLMVMMDPALDPYTLDENGNAKVVGDDSSPDEANFAQDQIYKAERRAYKLLPKETRTFLRQTIRVAAMKRRRAVEHVRKLQEEKKAVTTSSIRSGKHEIEMDDSASGSGSGSGANVASSPSGGPSSKRPLQRRRVTSLQERPGPTQSSTEGNC